MEPPVCEWPLTIENRPHKESSAWEQEPQPLGTSPERASAVGEVGSGWHVGVVLEQPEQDVGHPAKISKGDAHPT